MTVIHQIKKKEKMKVKAVIGVALVLAAIVISAAVVALVTGSSGKSDNMTVQETTTVYFEQLSVADSDVMDLQESIDGGQEYYIDYVFVAENQDLSGLLDIHIRFPDGEDYIVASGKRVTEKAGEGFYMFLDDRDVHMLSSARTDRDVYEGTQLYLSSYNFEGQEDNAADYPWNIYVMSSFEAAEGTSEEIYGRRMQLEENLLAFMNQALQK